MALKLLITQTDYDALNDTLKAEYTQQSEGDGFTLETIKSGGFAVENVEGLKKTVTTLRTDLSAAKVAADAFTGIEDPEKARLALQKYEEMENWDGDAKVAETVKAQMATVTKKHGEEITKVQNSLVSAEAQLKNSLVTSSATIALQEAEGNVKLLLPHLLGRVQMELTSDGTYKAQVLDESGQPAIGDGQGNPMTITQLVTEMKQDESFAAGFDGTGNTGSGASKTNEDGMSTKSVRGRTVISADDQSGMNNNLLDIASGKAIVEMTV